MIILQYVPRARAQGSQDRTPENDVWSVASDPRTATASQSARGSSDALDGLATILDEAAWLHLDDHAGWDRLAAAARGRIRELVSLGRVPEHLDIRDGEPAVVVRRTVAVAWQHAMRTMGRG